MEASSVLLIGDSARDIASPLLAESPLLSGFSIRTATDVAEAREILDNDGDIAAVVLVWGSGDPAALPAAVERIQERQHNPLMSILVRCRTPVPEAVADELWRVGIADRHFGEPPDSLSLADSLAVVLREYRRHRMHEAVATASTRLAKAANLAELTATALALVGNMDIDLRGAMFCYERATSHKQLLAVAGTGIYSEYDCTPVDQLADPAAREWIVAAWTAGRCRFGGDLAALYVGSAACSHPALILLAPAEPLQPWQQYLLETFAKIIAPAVEENQTAQQLMRTQRAMIATLAALAEYKDSDTGEHVARVARIAAEIAGYLAQNEPELGIDAFFLDHIGHASIMHDLGKVAIPEGILLKSGALEAQERQVINGHAGIGSDILRKAAALAADGEARLFRLAAEIALSHHERYDGTGYPQGLCGESIPLSARIVAVVDVFDALISQRPYKQPWSVDKAIDLIRSEAGRHFDPKVVAAFIAVQQRKADADYIRWSEDMSVGHAELDRDHQRLIGILNHLGINAELGNRNIVEFILDDLADYARVHFEREERHLEAIGFTELERHRSIHENIARRIEDAKWEYFQGFSAGLEDDLLRFLTSWLNHHILVEDMKYKRSGAAQT